MTIERRLLAKVTPGNGECLIWTGAKAGNGYGVIHYQRKLSYVHRVVWQLFNGAIKEGYCVLHTCDNPACCNIDHLFLGSKRDNTQDMMRKGRNNPPMKIRCEDFSEIKSRYAAGETYAQIGKAYNVHRVTISRIVNGDRDASSSL